MKVLNTFGEVFILSYFQYAVSTRNNLDLAFLLFRIFVVILPAIADTLNIVSIMYLYYFQAMADQRYRKRIFQRNGSVDTSINDLEGLKIDDNFDKNGRDINTKDL